MDCRAQTSCVAYTAARRSFLHAKSQSADIAKGSETAQRSLPAAR
jgi:hypothetical protein